MAKPQNQHDNREEVIGSHKSVGCGMIEFDHTILFRLKGMDHIVIASHGLSENDDGKKSVKDSVIQKLGPGASFKISL
jgi:hypothetical protein